LSKLLRFPKAHGEREGERERERRRERERERREREKEKERRVEWSVESFLLSRFVLLETREPSRKC
jgi:hypothetical protein